MGDPPYIEFIDAIHAIDANMARVRFYGMYGRALPCDTIDFRIPRPEIYGPLTTHAFGFVLQRCARGVNIWDDRHCGLVRRVHRLFGGPGHETTYVGPASSAETALEAPGLNNDDNGRQT